MVVRRVAVVVVLVLAVVGRAHADDVEAKAHQIEQRLVAPCCWTQTVDVHESELVTQLRQEIRARLRAGEVPLSIEDAMAQRFGERVRAMPRGKSPMLAFGQWTSVLLVLGLGSLIALAISWRRRQRKDEATPAPATVDAELDQELDRALSRLD